MIGYPRSGYLSDINPEIKSLGIINSLQHLQAERRQFHHFSPCLTIQQFQVRLVAVGNYHQVSACIWEAVKNNKGPLTTIYDQVLGAIEPFQRAAKYALVIKIMVFYICHTPRGPDIIQEVISEKAMLILCTSREIACTYACISAEMRFVYKISLSEVTPGFIVANNAYSWNS